MRRRLPVLLAAIALCAVATGSLHAWVAYTTARWPGSATMTLNRSSVANVSASQAAAAIQTAMSAWNNAGAKMTLSLSGGDTNVNQLANDGVSAIFFRQDSSGSAIATTYTWWDGNNRMIDSDIVFWNGGRVFFAGSSGCSSGYYIEDIAAHELGHVIGLDHSYFVDANGQTATMYPTTGWCDQNFRSLSSDDIDGIRSLYGVGSSGTGGSGGSGGSGGTITASQISSPAAGSTLVGSSQTFSWVVGTGASSFWLYLGSTPGARDLLEQSVGTSTSFTATALPTDGRTIYATLWWMRNGGWEQNAKTYTAATISGISGTGGTSGTGAALASPAAGSTFSGSSQTFTWTAGNGTDLWLYLGSTAGGKDLLEKSLTSLSSITATNLPTDGRRIYATLWYTLSGGWQHTDVTYTAASSGGTTTGGTGTPTLTSPAAGSTLSGSTQTFTWSAGSASQLWLYLGSTAGGKDLLELALGSGSIYTASGLPTDGRRIYATLWFVQNGSWQHADTTYTAAGSGGTGSTGTAPTLTSPVAGSTLSGSSQTFTWTAGSGASQLWLYLGSTAGGKDLLEKALSGSSITATGLPTDGRRIYATLWFVQNGSWQHTDTTYTAFR